MRLIINASTLSGTGVTQVAVSFIEECRKISDNEYFVFLSKRVASQLAINEFPSNFTFYKITTHPRYLFKGYSTRKYLRNLENAIKPDCVFSVFGPSYWTPKSPHIMGYAYPHYVYPESPIFKLLSLQEKIRFFIYKFLHRYFLKKNGDFYICETEDVSNRLKYYLTVNRNNIYTVSNTYNHFFKNFVPNENMLYEKKENEFRFLSLCSFAAHKNLEILNKVIPIINSLIKDIKVIFVLTVDNREFESRISIEAKSSIINLGLVDVSQCPQLYYECDALFLPSLLECFSANYVEAMKMKKPILTSNLSFATTVCNKSALYFDPLNPEDIVDKLLLVINNADLRNRLVTEGEKELLNFNTSERRALSYLEICNKKKRKNGEQFC